MLTVRGTRFRDRRDAGVRLAQKLADLKGTDVRILALPRGGVPVAAEIARLLDVPFEVFVVRKVGLPGHPEFAIGAVASGGVRVVNPDALAEFRVSRATLDDLLAAEEREVARRDAVYRAGRPFPSVVGVTVVLVDDGVATGATMVAAIRATRELGAGRIVVASPVIAASTRQALLREADAVECVTAPDALFAVGAWYDDFRQMTDAEVVSLLRPARGAQPAPPLAMPNPRSAHTLRIPIPGGTLTGDLALPAGARGLVIFVHGSGSGRASPRNRSVAAALQGRGFATLLFDLLTPTEDEIDRATSGLRFNVRLLSHRLIAVTDWAAGLSETEGLPVGYFGASTGAAAAILAAAARPALVRAVVSRGGRPDLAAAAFAQLRAPTLLIVGGADHQVLALNRDAAAHMTGATARLATVPGATHLFAETGAMAEVVRLASDWFDLHLGARAPVYAGGG